MDPASPNPFGHVDHSEFAGFGAELVWGKTADDRIISIREAARGLACDCVCPACGGRLVAHKGKHTAHHFKHHRSAKGCGYGRETNAHYWAKALLVTTKRIWTPEVVAEAGGARRKVSAAKWMTFTDVRSEKRLGGIVPDIVLILPDQRELIVEIWVTHACGDDKIDLIRDNRWPAIEIDLRRLRTSQDVAAIEHYLLHTAPREWLCNPRRDREEDKLRDELAAAAAAKADRERQRIERERKARIREERATATAGLALMEAANAAGNAPRPPVELTLARIIDKDERYIIGVRSDGEGFLVDTATWQAALIARFVEYDDARTFAHETFDLAGAMATVDPYIAPAFKRPVSDAVKAWIRGLSPRFQFPEEAVASYLEMLCHDDVLEDTGLGYALSEREADALDRRRHHLLEQDHRAETTHALVDQIIADLPPEEVVEFEAPVWLQATLPLYGKSPRLLIDRGGEDHRDLVVRLRKIAGIVAGGEDSVDQLLGLPIVGAASRASTRKAARLAREAAARVARLRPRALAFWGAETESWLTTRLGEGRPSPLAMAEGGEMGLHEALDIVREAEAQRATERRTAAEIESRRARLSEAIKGWFPEAHRAMAMTNFAPELGCSPYDAARTEAGLTEALRALGARVGARRQAPGKRR